MKLQFLPPFFQVLLAVLVSALLTSFTLKEGKRVESSDPVRYVSIGDSYTAGEGAQKGEAWPSRLTRNLKAAGIDIQLVANPAVTGWTVEQALAQELPIFEKSDPTFATLLIGVNDWVKGSGRSKFTSGFRTLLDRMIAKLPGPERLLLITIPDFSCSPQGSRYGHGRNITKGISRYNLIIRSEAEKRNLRVVDLFPLSTEFCGRPEMFAEDGIHPNSDQYALWEKLIFPVAYEMLTNDKTLPSQ